MLLQVLSQHIYIIVKLLFVDMHTVTDWISLLDTLLQT